MNVRLLDIAHARSGDKGDTANVGVIALRPEWFPVLQLFLTKECVARHFAGAITGKVERFELPNLGAVNFLLQGKVFSTAMLRMVLDIPDSLAARYHLPSAAA